MEIPRRAELTARLTQVEQLAHSNRRELDIQLQRIADIQAELDELRSQIGARRARG